MTDSLGPNRKYKRWRDAAEAVWREQGWKGYWRGFLPCFLRAFPGLSLRICGQREMADHKLANAMALVAFEGVMRWLP